MDTPILEIRDLRKAFHIRRGPFRHDVLQALNGVSLTVEQGHNVGLVGESGCGKTTLARCVLGLEATTSGQIIYRGERIDHLGPRRFKSYRNRIQIVFQDPTDSLNPRLTVKQSLEEPLKRTTDLPRSAYTDRLVETMEAVGLGREHLGRYPHQLSTGQQQRVGIARAIISEPDFVVLDEPTSALDISVRGRVLELLAELQHRLDMTYLLISHDLSTIRYVTDKTVIMYLGSVMEIGPTRAIFERPIHPYTQALLSAIPSIRPGKRGKRIILRGEIPSPLKLPRGCVFHTRCPLAQKLGNPRECHSHPPKLERTADGRRVACHFHDYVHERPSTVTGGQA